MRVCGGVYGGCAYGGGCACVVVVSACVVVYGGCECVCGVVVVVSACVVVVRVVWWWL